MENSTLKMPAVALRGMTILPGMITHFDVSRSRSVKAVERAVAEGQPLFVVTQRDPEMETPEQDDVFAVGIISEVKQIVKMPHNIMRVLVEGVDRAGLLELSGEEKENAKADMEKMLDYIDTLNELDTEGIEPMSHVFPVNNVFREDVVTNGDGSGETLANAPLMKDNSFKVPKTIG